MDLDGVKYDVAIANRILALTGLADGITTSVGHASMRVPDRPELFVIKGRGYDMDVVGLMRPEQMVVCDLEGYKVEGPPNISQCYEVKMHSCIYRARPDVQSVVHVHPRFTILMSVLEKRLRPMSNAGAQLVREPLPVYPHSKLILTEKDGVEVAEALGSSRAILLKGHGAASTGGSLQESVTTMLQLEEQAKLNTYAFGLAGADHPYMSEEMLTEARNRPRYEDQPHFKDSYNPSRHLPNGFWAYYTVKAAAGLEAGS